LSTEYLLITVRWNLLAWARVGNLVDKSVSQSRPNKQNGLSLQRLVPDLASCIPASPFRTRIGNCYSVTYVTHLANLVPKF